jgi:hypothetical protein
VDINESTLAETATLANDPDRLSTHVVNITDKAAVAVLPEAVTERFGAVDGLTHCAGIIQPFVRLKDLDDAATERVFAVNWWGTLYLTKAFLPVLLARPEGHIVNTSSMGGFLPVPGQTVYGASKAAVKLLTEGLHAECPWDERPRHGRLPGCGRDEHHHEFRGRHPRLARDGRAGRSPDAVGRQGGAADPRRDGAERLPGVGRQRRPADGRPLPDQPERRGVVHRPAR